MHFIIWNNFEQDNYWMKERGTSKEISTNSYEGNINAVMLFKNIFDIWDLCFENKQIYFRDIKKDVLYVIYSNIQIIWIFNFFCQT